MCEKFHQMDKWTKFNYLFTTKTQQKFMVVSTSNLRPSSEMNMNQDEESYHPSHAWMGQAAIYWCQQPEVTPDEGLTYETETLILVLSLSFQSSVVEQVLDILMDILSWEIAEVVSPCLPHGLWPHIVIRVFLLLGTVWPRHPPCPVLPSCCLLYTSDAADE